MFDLQTKITSSTLPAGNQTQAWSRAVLAEARGLLPWKQSPGTISHAPFT